MYTIVECGGFQFKVAQGDVITVPLMNVEQDAEITLERVLLACDDRETRVGRPTVEGAVVKAKVLEHGKGPKILVMKRKRRKRYKRKNGHRQGYTKLQITSIVG